MFLDKTGLKNVITEVKKIMDTYLGKLSKKDTVSEADLDIALKNKINNASAANHSHTNKKILDGITQENIDKWNKNSSDVGEVINVDSALIGTEYIGVQASMTFQKLSDTKGNLHISYHIIRNDKPSDESGFISTDAISNALNLNFSWSDYFAQSRIILVPLFKNYPSDRLEIISAFTTYNPEMAMGQTGFKIGIERTTKKSLVIYPSNDSMPAIKLNDATFSVGTYGHINIYGVDYLKK